MLPERRVQLASFTPHSEVATYPASPYPHNCETLRATNNLGSYYLEIFRSRFRNCKVDLVFDSMSSAPASHFQPTPASIPPPGAISLSLRQPKDLPVNKQPLVRSPPTEGVVPLNLHESFRTRCLSCFEQRKSIQTNSLLRIQT